MAETVGRAVYEVGVDHEGFDKELDQLGKRSQSRLKGIAKAGALALGGLLGGAALGAAVGLKNTTTGLIDAEKELRPMIQRSRFGAETLQALAEAAKRAGSEDGLEGIVDTSQELQLQLGELAMTGNARALPALEALGLEAAKLQAMEPEQAWRAVVSAIQEIPNVADRAIAAEEIFGGTSEKLAGIVNLTASEFASLEAEVQRTSDIWSGEALESAKTFDLELQHIRTDLGRGANALVVRMLPSLIEVAKWIRETGIPTWQELKAQAIQPITEFIETSVIPKMQEFWVNTLQPMAATLRDDVFPAVKELLDSGLRTLIEVLAELTPVFTSLWNDVLQPLATQVLDTLLPVLAELATIFRDDIWPLLRDYILPIFLDLIQNRLKLIKYVYDEFVRPALALLMEAFESLMPTLSELAENLFPILADIIETAVVPALELILDPLNKLTELFGGTKEKGDEVSGIFTDISDAIQPVIEWFRDDLIPVVKELAEFAWPLIVEVWEDSLKPTFEELVEFGRDVIIPLLRSMFEIFKWAWDQIDWIVVPLIKSIMLVIETVIEIAFAIVRTLLNVLAGDWEGAWQSIKDLVESFIELITGLFKVWGLDELFANIWKSIKTSFTTAFDFIENAFRGYVNIYIDLINSVIRALNTIDVDIPNWVPVFGGRNFGLDIPEVPRLADGGVVQEPTLAMIGEAGPEAVVPLDRLGGGIGGGIHITVEGDILAENFYDLVADAVNQANRRGVDF